MESLLAKHIEKTPGIRTGKPRITGTRICVSDVAIWHEWQGLSPEEIVSSYPQLSLADVYAALAYYFDNRDEIRRQMQETESFVTAHRERHPSKPPAQPLPKDDGGAGTRL